MILRTITIDDREMLVRVSDELLAELAGDWSEPVRIKAEQNADGTWIFVCKRADSDARTALTRLASTETFTVALDLEHPTRVKTEAVIAELHARMRFAAEAVA